MDTGPYDSFRPDVIFTEDELRLLLDARPPAPGRDRGVFTVREVAAVTGWSIDRARRVVFGLADAGRAEQTFVKARKRNGVWQTVSAYRLLTEAPDTSRTDVLVEDLLVLLRRHGLADNVDTARRMAAVALPVDIGGG